MNTTPHCPRCGTPLPADLPEAQCPKCMLGVGLGSQTGGATEVTESGSPPPAPADLAPHFSQLEILELLGQGGRHLLFDITMPTIHRAKQRAQEMAAIAGDSELIRSFAVSDPTLSPGLTVTNGAWFLHSTHAQTVRLFEVSDLGIEQAVLIYRADLP